jgi:CTP synthase
MTFAGTSPDDQLVEIVEIASHPWFVAVQFHPEFKSKPTKAHPLFAGFVEAAIDRHSRRQKKTPETQPQTV